MSYDDNDNDDAINLPAKTHRHQTSEVCPVIFCGTHCGRVTLHQFNKIILNQESHRRQTIFVIFRGADCDNRVTLYYLCVTVHVRPY